MPAKKFASSFLPDLASLYSPRYPLVLVDTLEWLKYRGWVFVKWYWTTSNFSRLPRSSETKKKLAEQVLYVLLAAGMITELVIGFYLMYLSVSYQLSGVWEFGLALLIAYPIFWALVLAVATLLANAINALSPARLSKRRP